MKHSIAAILGALGVWSVGCGGTEETASRPVYESTKEISTMATVEAVDKERREVTLKGPHGNTILCVADQGVRNFDQLEAGDQVQITYIEATAVEVVKNTGEDKENVVVERAPAGEKPGGVAVREASMTAEVVGIDHAAGTITLKNDQGRVTEVAVRHPERLHQVKVGEFLRVRYRESVAVKVEPAADKVR